MKKTLRTLLAAVAITAAPCLPARADDLTQTLILGNQIDQFIEDFKLKMENWELIERQIESVKNITSRLERMGSVFGTANSIAQTTGEFYRTADALYGTYTTLSAYAAGGQLSGSWALKALQVYETFCYKGYVLVSDASSSWKSLLNTVGRKKDGDTGFLSVMETLQDKLADGVVNITREAQDSTRSIAAGAAMERMARENQEFLRKMPAY